MKKISFATLFLSLLVLISCNQNRESVTIQAHRGGAGLMPENTIEAMKRAIDLGVDVLEVDLNISQDGEVVVSHDPFMNSGFVLTPSGDEIAKGEERNYLLYKMKYDSIRRFDVGSKPYATFPEQRRVRSYKPLLTELIDSVELYAQRRGVAAPNYNIEIKSNEALDGIATPPYRDFVDMCMAVLMQKGLGDRFLVQSFDTRALNYLNERYPDVVLSYLVSSKHKDLVKSMERINFTPEWCSPHYSLLSSDVVEEFRAMGVKLAPWTVDSHEDMEAMVDLGVESIITNYPDRLLKILGR
ncbi:MAG: glycerophosphodiester phosphodiesterase family protein [Rikenellaceae bacterium]